MKNYFRFFIILNIFVFSINLSVYASSSGGHAFGSQTLYERYENFKNLSNPTESDIKDIISDLIQGGGFIINTYKWGNDFLSNLKNRFGLPSNSSNNDIYNYIVNNIDDSNNNISISDSFNSQLVDIGNDFINLNEYYIGYSYDVSDSSLGSTISNIDREILSSFVSSVQNGKFVILSNNRVFVIPRNIFFLWYNLAVTDNYFTLEYFKNNNNISDLTWNNSNVDMYVYDSSNRVFNLQNNNDSSIIGCYVSNTLDNNVGYQNFYTGYHYLVSSGYRETVIIYKNINSFDSDLPYYFNNDIKQIFSTSTGGYVYSPSNTNTVTYNDVINYQDQYYDDHSYYPDMSQVNTWIEDSHDNNINNGGGSGNGSGDDDGDGDDDSIFDWLKSLGKVLGDLIRGIGNFLSEIIGGLVSAITSLLESLSGLITGTLESLTNIFSGLISFVYSGLPQEVQAVMILALSVSLLITVIELIRR